MNIGQKTGSAGLFLFLRKIWAAILYIITFAYLARVLSKEDFGLIAISSAFISLIEVFGSRSIQEYLVYKRNDVNSKSLINSAFWLNVTLAILVMTSCFLIAPLVAIYFDNEKIKYLIYIMGLCFVGHSLSAIPVAILRKRLDFKAIIIIQFITGTLSQFTQLLLATIGFGVYSLAIPSAIFPLITGVYLMYVTKPRISMNLGVKKWPRILSYTRYIMGNRALERIAGYGDNFIIGKMLSLPILGIYNIAYKLANVFTDNIQPILNDVTVPVFANSSDDGARLRRRYSAMLRLSVVFFIPIHIMLIVFAHLLVTTIYGIKWVDAVLPLQILSAMAMIKCVMTPASHMYYVMGLKRVPFYIMLVYIPVFGVLLWWLSSKGLVFASLGLAVGGIVLSMFNFLFTAKVIKLGYHRLLKDIMHVIVPSIIVAAISLLGLHYSENLYLSYLLFILFLPIIAIMSFLFYKKDVLKDYIIMSQLFPVIRKFR